MILLAPAKRRRVWAEVSLPLNSEVHGVLPDPCVQVAKAADARHGRLACGISSTRGRMIFARATDRRGRAPEDSSDRVQCGAGAPERGFRACVRGGSSEVTVACTQASLRRHAQVAIGGLCAPVLLGLLLCLAAR